MSTFEVYARLGFEHIADLEGYDHILFIVALAALYRLKDWKQVAILVTAFTIGHSVTLALATLNIVRVDSGLIEFLIPVTIVITCIFNYFQSPKATNKGFGRYGIALFFGLIHGLGFSNYLRSLLGRNESIVFELFAFNIGLEIGQLLIVMIILLISWLMVNLLRMKAREWVLLLSGAAGGISLLMALERIGGIL